MAKEVRQHTAVHGIRSLLGAINKVTAVELGGIKMTPETQKEALDAVTQATGIIDESNFITALENMDDAIELQHEVEAAEEAEEAERQFLAEEEE